MVRVTFQEIHSGCFPENRQLGGKGLDGRPAGRLPQEARQKIRAVGGWWQVEVVRCRPL